jgi:ATP-dependent RNA helicase DHX8/PRP22
MDELQKLEHLSLVSKICTELDNHYNMNDKDLAEFIIDLAEKNSTLDKFKKALSSNGAEFADSFVENILRIIKHMKPKMAGDPAAGSKKSEKISKTKVEKLAENFPFLSLPDKKAKEDEGCFVFITLKLQICP